MMTLDYVRSPKKPFPVQAISMPTPAVHSCSSLFDKLPEKVYKKGETIFSQRNAHLHVYRVTKGIVKIYSLHDGKEMLEDYCQKGEMFNCEALFDADRGGLAAEAMTQLTTVKKIPVLAFRQAMMGNAPLYKEVLKTVSNSLNRTQERLRRMTLLNSHHRVIDFLADHAVKSGRRVGYEWVVKPAMTHQDMGNITGTSRQTVTTVLNELRRERLIHFTRNYLIVRDLDALLKMTGRE
ncbi:MAG TPA: Crp/Fnr family transcriptional regulator [Bacteroidetes bacterium]|nr:Crp/Fnr family transcriptional regulator [Bacteroidota bacterium]